MLVQTKRCKRPWYAPNKRTSSLSLKSEEDSMRRSSVVDKKYEEFYEKRRTNSLLKVINAVMDAPIRRDMELKCRSQQKANEPNKLDEKLSIKKSSQETKLKDDSKEMLNLATENKTLRKHLSFVYNRLSETDKLEQKKRFQHAVLKYRVEIYQNKWLVSKAKQTDATLNLQRVKELEGLLLDLKLDNCTLRTNNEELRLRVEDLHEQLNNVQVYFQMLTSNVDEFLGNYQVRLEKAFGDLHKLKCSKSLKTSKK